MGANGNYSDRHSSNQMNGHVQPQDEEKSGYHQYQQPQKHDMPQFSSSSDESGSIDDGNGRIMKVTPGGPDAHAPYIVDSPDRGNNRGNNRGNDRGLKHVDKNKDLQDHWANQAPQ